MRMLSPLCVTAFLLAGAQGAGAQAIPDFAPDTNTSWFPDRPAGDDFLPPPNGGPGPVMSDPAHPYIPNGSGQPTYRVADLSNPNLKPWVVEDLRKKNEQVLAGGIPFSARERCWPGGVPQFDIFRRVSPVYIFQTPKEVLLIWQTDQQVRHVYLDVPHSAHPKPSWYGESIGHYEGDTLVVDTIGLNDKSFVDNYNTPHTTALHTIERFRIVDGGNTLEIAITVEDEGAFNAPWHGVQRFKRWLQGPMLESICAENNFDFLSYKVAPIPQALKADF